jgi:hypothetical protein
VREHREEKIRERTNLIMDRKKEEMREGDKREGDGQKWNIKRWVLWIMYNDCKKREKKNKKKKTERT